MGFHGVGGHVHGVVHDLQEEFAAAEAIHVQDIDGFFTGLNVGISASGSKQLAATCIEQHHSCDVLVVAGSDRQGVAGHTVGDIHQFRGSVVHHSGEGHGSALAQCVPVGIALSIYVVLRSQSQLGDNAIAFFQVGNRPAHAHGHGGVDPVTLIDEIVGACHRAGFFASQHVSIAIGDPIAGVGGVADNSAVPHVELVTADAVDGVTLRLVALVGDHRVAAKQIGRVGVVAVDNGNGVAVGDAHVGITGLVTSQIFCIGTDVKHGGFSPAAIEAQ